MYTVLTLSLASIVAPPATSTSMTLRLLYFAAICSGVLSSYIKRNEYKY